MKRRWTTAPWSLKCCVKGAQQCMRNCRDWMSCAPKRRRITRHRQMPVCNTVVVYCFHSWNTFYYSLLLLFYTILLLFSDSNYDALKQFIFWATPSLGLTFASQSAVCSLCILSTHSAWIDAFDMACHHTPRKGAIQSKVQISVKNPACRSPHQAKENEMRNAVLIEKQRREQYQRMATGLQELGCC